MLYRESLAGDVFLAGIERRLETGDREAAIRACERARGAPLAEVLLAGLEAVPRGPEAVDAAVDEAILEWRPDVLEGERALAVLGRVSGLTGLFVGAIAIGRAFRQVGEGHGTLRTAVGGGFGTALTAVAIGVSAMILAILAKGILRRRSITTRSDLEKAVNLLARNPLRS